MKWYKRDPDAWLAGVVPLTLEERGAYDTVIDLLYSRNGVLPNDDQFFARHCNCDPRTWRRVRDNLIQKGKLHYEPDGNLMARRVRDELERATRRIEVMSELRQKQLQDQRSAPDTNARTTTTTTRKKEPPNGALELPLEDHSKERTNGTVPRLPSKEADFFKRGREVLGEKSGGLIKKLLQHENGDVIAAWGIIENAADADRPREYVAAALRRSSNGGWQ